MLSNRRLSNQSQTVASYHEQMCIRDRPAPSPKLVPLRSTLANFRRWAINSLGGRSKSESCIIHEMS